MMFRRNEGFRYTFDNPIGALYKIASFETGEFEDEIRHGVIMDISPSGLKLRSAISLPLPIAIQAVDVEISFMVFEDYITVNGKIIWEKQNFDKSYLYGIQLETDHLKKSRIVAELKKHAQYSKAQ